MDRFTYAKDVRTDEQARADFIKGKRREAYIAKMLPFEVVLNKKEEKYGDVGIYQPDGKIKLWGSWHPLEIKGYPKRIPSIDFKKNQIDHLIPRKGVVVFGTPDLYILQSAKYIKDMGIFVSEKESFVYTDSYRMRDYHFIWRKY